MKSTTLLLAFLGLMAIGRAATIGQLVQSTPDLSTLATAVQSAGLLDELSDTSTQFTVFAPTNDAFTALLARLGVSAETLLADNSTVTSVLLYHVVPGVFTAADLKDGQVLQTLLPGGTITVQKAADGTVTLIPTGGPPATVTMADIAADNGIVHIVDGVLLPGVSPAPSGE